MENQLHKTTERNETTRKGFSYQLQLYAHHFLLRDMKM